MWSRRSRSSRLLKLWTFQSSPAVQLEGRTDGLATNLRRKARTPPIKKMHTASTSPEPPHAPHRHNLMTQATQNLRTKLFGQ
eukprot:4099795-Karenia_brevis.AAC.1